MADASPVERVGAICFVGGSILLAVYAIGFVLLLPVRNSGVDFAALVLQPAWKPLAGVALVAIVLAAVGLDAIYLRIRDTAGASGAIGVAMVRIAVMLQACAVSWELLLDPVIAGHAATVFLIRDRVIVDQPAMALVRGVSLLTLVLGIGLFGTAVYRSGKFPKIAFALIGAGTMLFAAGPLVSLVLAASGVFAIASGFVLIGVRLIHSQT